MKNSILASIRTITGLSIIFFSISIFDELFLPLAFYVWNLLPVLLILDLIFCGINYLIDKKYKCFDFKYDIKHSNPTKPPKEKNNNKII